MMIPYGYKQTEVGVIPEDWELLLLGKTAKVYRGGSPRPIQSYITNSSNGVNWIKIGDVRENDKYIYSTQEKIRPDGISMSREVHIGDFILSNSMSFGRPYILRTNGCIHDGWLTIQEYGQAFSTEYLYYLLSSKIIYKQYIGMAAGSSVKNLNKDKVSSLMVICPPLPEQQRIAEALSDVDGMISSLEKLVAKYKSIKTACLQQMFPQNGETVPRMRLPGFTGAWEQRKLMSLCEKFTDGDWIEAKDQSDFGVRLIQTGNVGLGEYIDKPTNKKWIAEETFERLNCEEVFAGDILISRLPEPAGRACIMPNLGVKMITAVDCTIVRTATHINPKCLLQYLSSQSYFDKVNTCLAGGTRQRISRSNLAAFDVPVPAKYEEQKAIGEFLCGIDHLITLHQRKLEKIQKIKQGMMQQLLTGKIRLV